MSKIYCRFPVLEVIYCAFGKCCIGVNHIYCFLSSKICIVCVFLRLILEFELRTKEESGLVLYMARINHADFVTIQVSIYCSDRHCMSLISSLFVPMIQLSSNV